MNKFEKHIRVQEHYRDSTFAVYKRIILDREIQFNKEGIPEKKFQERYIAHKMRMATEEYARDLFEMIIESYPHILNKFMRNITVVVDFDPSNQESTTAEKNPFYDTNLGSPYPWSDDIKFGPRPHTVESINKLIAEPKVDTSQIDTTGFQRKKIGE